MISKPKSTSEPQLAADNRKPKQKYEPTFGEIDTFLKLAKLLQSERVDLWTEAAAKLQLPRPYLSKVLRVFSKLHRRNNNRVASMVEKSGEGLTLTDEGKRVLEWAEQLQKLYAQAHKLFTQPRGRISIGANNPIAAAVLPECLHEFLSQRLLRANESLSGPDIHVYEEGLVDFITDLRTGKIDFGIGGRWAAGRLEGLKATMLRSDLPTVLIAHPAHPDFGRKAFIAGKSIRLARLAKEPVCIARAEHAAIMRRDQLEHEGPGSTRIYVDTHEPLRAIVQAGAAVAILCDLDGHLGFGFRKQWGVVVHPMDVREFPLRELCIWTEENHTPSEDVAALLRIIESQVKRRGLEETVGQPQRSGKQPRRSPRPGGN